MLKKQISTTNKQQLRQQSIAQLDTVFCTKLLLLKGNTSLVIEQMYIQLKSITPVADQIQFIKQIVDLCIESEVIALEAMDEYFSRIQRDRSLAIELRQNIEILRRKIRHYI